MNIHVLPGDAVTENFKRTNIEGEIIVCRECLVEGDVEAGDLEDFWQTRARFIEQTYGEEVENYFQKVRREFENLANYARAGAEINLWFEYELFCQVNLWFTVYLLSESRAKIFRVAPVVRKRGDIWRGFGDLTAEDFEKCFAERVEFSEKEIRLGADLWRAYRDKDYERLKTLSQNHLPCFPHLREVCLAEMEKSARPREVLKDIIAKGEADFSEIFREFSGKAGVYGFGDLQVKRILEEI